MNKFLLNCWDLIFNICLLGFYLSIAYSPLIIALLVINPSMLLMLGFIISFPTTFKVGDYLERKGITFK